MQRQLQTARRPLYRGDIVLVPFPFTDLSAAKRRPAAVIAVDSIRDDVLVAFVSTQGVGSPQTGEVVLFTTHPEFVLTGLSTPSVIRAGKLVTLNRQLVTRWLGRIGPILTADLDHALVISVGINTVPYREHGRAEERARLVRLHSAGGTASVLDDLGITTE